MRRVIALVGSLSVLLASSTVVWAQAKGQVPSATRSIRQQDARVLANTRHLLAQYNTEVMAGRSATLPLFTVLKSLADMIGETNSPVETARHSTLRRRQETEYEVLIHVNQEIVQITRSLASPS
ncbi:MAG: hypothetical protein M1415_11640 [Firmicutes bacterium]|nr:hypothetical protein [Bacillota bacterium]MCL5065012.1 hypothetical protein [Bacillota bacterium]